MVQEISAEHEVFCFISTDTAYSCDPRIKKFKEEEKARKESEKKAKADAKKKEQEEKERVSVINFVIFSILCWQTTVLEMFRENWMTDVW